MHTIRYASLIMGTALATVTAASGSPASNASNAGGWSRLDLHAVTQPAAVGDRVIVLAESGGNLRLLGLDAATGQTRWSQPASTADNAPGEPPTVAVVEGRIIYLRAAAAPYTAEVAGADPRSGRTVWHSRPARFTAWPDLCPNSATTVCVSSAFGPIQYGSVQRFDARTGHPKSALVVSRNPYAREVGTGLYDPGERRPEMLVASDGARVTWARPLRAIFPYPGASTDWGWSFQRVERLGLFIGSAGSTPRKRKGMFISDLSRAMTAAFRVDNGIVAWRSPGFYECDYLPCAGETQIGYEKPGVSDTPTVGVRLIAKGIASGPANELPRLSPGARATLQGFDPATGQTRWTFIAGHNTGLILDTYLPARLSAETIAVRGPSGKLEAVDLHTGAHHQIPPSTPAWCSRFIEYRLATGYRSGAGGTTHQYNGQYAVVACTAAGRRARQHPTRVPQFIGARTSGLVAWTDTHGVIAEPAAP